MGYDKNGNMTTRHVWNGANITADITGASATTYARGAGLIFSGANGQKQYYAFNGHGDTVSVTDAQGNLLQGYDYVIIRTSRESPVISRASALTPFSFFNMSQGADIILN